MAPINIDEATGEFTRAFSALAQAMAKEDEPITPTGWAHTHKMRPTGDGHRDRLVAARLNLRRSE